MSSDSSGAKAEATQHGNGSVAHQIIGEFIAALASQPQYAEVSARLSKVVFEGKVSDTSMRIALFGELEL